MVRPVGSEGGGGRDLPDNSLLITDTLNKYQKELKSLTGSAWGDKVDEILKNDPWTKYSISPNERKQFISSNQPASTSETGQKSSIRSSRRATKVLSNAPPRLGAPTPSPSGQTPTSQPLTPAQQEKVRDDLQDLLTNDLYSQGHGLNATYQALEEGYQICIEKYGPEANWNDVNCKAIGQYFNTLMTKGDPTASPPIPAINTMQQTTSNEFESQLTDYINNPKNQPAGMSYDDWNNDVREFDSSFEQQLGTAFQNYLWAPTGSVNQFIQTLTQGRNPGPLPNVPSPPQTISTIEKDFQNWATTHPNASADAKKFAADIVAEIKSAGIGTVEQLQKWITGFNAFSDYPNNLTPQELHDIYAETGVSSDVNFLDLESKLTKYNGTTPANNLAKYFTSQIQSEIQQGKGLADFQNWAVGLDNTYLENQFPGLTETDLTNIYKIFGKVPQDVEPADVKTLQKEGVSYVLVPGKGSSDPNQEMAFPVSRTSDSGGAAMPDCSSTEAIWYAMETAYDAGDKTFFQQLLNGYYYLVELKESAIKSSTANPKPTWDSTPGLAGWQFTIGAPPVDKADDSMYPNDDTPSDPKHGMLSCATDADEHIIDLMMKAQQKWPDMTTAYGQGSLKDGYMGNTISLTSLLNEALTTFLTHNVSGYPTSGYDSSHRGFSYPPGTPLRSPILTNDNWGGGDSSKPPGTALNPSYFDPLCLADIYNYAKNSGDSTTEGYADNLKKAVQNSMKYLYNPNPTTDYPYPGLQQDYNGALPDNPYWSEGSSKPHPVGWDSIRYLTNVGKYVNACNTGLQDPFGILPDVTASGKMLLQYVTDPSRSTNLYSSNMVFDPGDGTHANITGGALLGPLLVAMKALDPTNPNIKTLEDSLDKVLNVDVSSNTDYSKWQTNYYYSVAVGLTSKYDAEQIPELPDVAQALSKWAQGRDAATQSVVKDIISGITSGTIKTMSDLVNWLKKGDLFDTYPNLTLDDVTDIYAECKIPYYDKAYLQAEVDLETMKNTSGNTQAFAKDAISQIESGTITSLKALQTWIQGQDLFDKYPALTVQDVTSIYDKFGVTGYDSKFLQAEFDLETMKNTPGNTQAFAKDAISQINSGTIKSLPDLQQWIQSMKDLFDKYPALTVQDVTSIYDKFGVTGYDSKFLQTEFDLETMKNTPGDTQAFAKDAIAQIESGKCSTFTELQAWVQGQDLCKTYNMTYASAIDIDVNIFGLPRFPPTADQFADYAAATMSSVPPPGQGFYFILLSIGAQLEWKPPVSISQMQQEIVAAGANIYHTWNRTALSPPLTQDELKALYLNIGLDPATAPPPPA